MISQFFEVQIRNGHVDRYMNLASLLRPRLDEMDGCLFIDRFKSLTRENLLLSYQVWLDEGTLTAWRAEERHHAIQTIRREEIFTDYRIRISQIVHEVRSDRSIWKSERRTPYNDPARRAASFVIASESTSPDLPVTTEWRHDSFESMYRTARFAHLIDLPDFASGLEFGAPAFRSSDRTHPYLRGHARLRHVRPRGGSAVLSAGGGGRPEAGGTLMTIKQAPNLPRERRSRQA
ncbi:heme-degrading monooxygenase HmoA [Bradyrhizobium sp. USDA 4503]